MNVFDQVLSFVPIGSLLIRHSQKSDQGKYECVAENRYGVAYSYTANLYVRGKSYVMSYVGLGRVVSDVFVLYYCAGVSLW